MPKVVLDRTPVLSEREYTRITVHAFLAEDVAPHASGPKWWPLWQNSVSLRQNGASAGTPLMLYVDDETGIITVDIRAYEASLERRKR